LAQHPIRVRSPDSLLRYPAFVSFWCAEIASSFGFQMLSVAVGWQVYAITGRARDLGWIGLVQFVPSVLLALPAGHMADQLDRKRIAVLGQIGQWCAIVALTALTLLHGLHEAGILALVFAMGVARALAFPATQSILPALVPGVVLPRAMAANASAGQAATIVGPAVGGLLYVAGPGAVYAAAAGLFLVATILMVRLQYLQEPPRREPATTRTVLAGVRFIRQRPDILGVISLDLFAVLLGGATALLPIFAKDILHTGPWGLGLLRGAPALGAMLMSFWLARHTLRRRVGMTMFAAVAGFGMATLVFALSRTLWLSLAALFTLGAFDMVSVVIRGALVQLETPDEMRGRVGAVNAVFIDTSSQLGEFESGMLAAWVGAAHAAALGGIGTLVVVGLWIALFPTLRRRQRLDGHADETIE
jgi:MFS family permease